MEGTTLTKEDANMDVKDFKDEDISGKGSNGVILNGTTHNDKNSQNGTKIEAQNNLLCPRCMGSGHWENSCSIVTLKPSQGKCDTCGGEDHLALVHNTKNFKQRQAIIQTIGWEPFRGWFLDFDFRNWWQLSGCTGVPFHKIYLTGDGKEKEWKNWDTHAPSKTKKHLKAPENGDRFSQRINMHSPIPMGYGTDLPETDETYQPPFPEGYEDNGMDDNNQLPGSSSETLGMENHNNYSNRSRSGMEDDRFDKLTSSNAPKEVPVKEPEIKRKPTKYSELQSVVVDPTNIAIKTSNPAIGLSWCQNDRLVAIKIAIEGIPNNLLKCETTEESLKVEISGNKPYTLEIEVAHPIMENWNPFSVSNTVDIKIKKDPSKISDNENQWKSLYKDKSLESSTMET